MAARYPLTPLITLRRFRQEKAMHRVGTVKKKLIQACKEVEMAKQKHREYLEWLKTEEQRRYQAIMETDMTLEDLEEFKQGLLNIRGMETGFLEEIIRAKHQRQVCETELEQAKSAMIAAQKACLRIEVHKEKWMEKVRQDQERAQELELEEFTSPAVMPA